MPVRKREFQQLPSIEKILTAFTYDAEAGRLLHKRTWGRAKVGCPAGTPDKQGMIVVGLNGGHYYLQELIWLLHTGVQSKFVRHRDGDKTNNHIDNLFALPENHRDLSGADVLGVFAYDRAAGTLTRRYSYAAGAAGSLGAYVHGFLKQNISGKQLAVHDLIWLIETGAWPETPIAHVNGIRDDNRIENLVLITEEEHKRARGVAQGKNRIAIAAEKFVLQAKQVHGGFYSYGKSVYVKAKQPVTVTCPKHGDFITQPDRHLRGVGCQTCADEKRTEFKRMPPEVFFSMAMSVHGGAYDYSRSVYTGCTDKVEIVCPTHGSFYQTPNGHLGGAGCEQCGRERAARKLLVPLEDFLTRATAAHGDTYDYGSVVLNGMGEKVEIVCKEHGTFWQQASLHANGCGCPACSLHLSRPELQLVEFLRANGLEVERSNRKIIRPKELDIVLPELKVAIEYCGVLWHSDKFKADKNYHTNKLTACAEAGYRLLTIFEDEYVFKKDLVLNLLRRVLGLGQVTRIGARSCEVRETSYSDIKGILERNHLQGAARAAHYYGMYHAGELVSCASVAPHRAFMGGAPVSGEMELVRYCQADGVAVHGGLGKLAAFAMRDLILSRLTSYVDRRWFTGSSYLTNGFTAYGSTAPNYWYVKGQKRMSRFTFARHTLKAKHESGTLPIYDDSLSEAEIMKLNGYLRIYDCGNLKMVRP